MYFYFLITLLLSTLLAVSPFSLLQVCKSKECQISETACSYLMLMEGDSAIDRIMHLVATTVGCHFSFGFESLLH